MRNLVLHIEQIKDKGLYLEFEEKPVTFPVLEEIIRNREFEFLGPLNVNIRAFRIRELFEIEGRFQTRVRLMCSRCLKNFEHELTSRFTLTYTRALPGLPEETTEKEVELRAEEIGLMYFKGEEIDLREGVQEQIVMTLPLKPLCDPKCRGLCPKCGADLNQADCGCRQEPVASEFSILKNLKLPNTGN